MISLYELRNKLNAQAKYFTELMELPDLNAQGLWARGVYSCDHFSAAHDGLIRAFKEDNLESILQHDFFKYLLINEYDDAEIIESLHIEVEKMAARIQGVMIVDTDTIEVISIIYRVLGLTTESNFVVNTGAYFQLEWRPYFDAIYDPLVVMYADLQLDGQFYRLIASKFPFTELSMDNIKKYMFFCHSQIDDDYEGCISEGNKFSMHQDWLSKTINLFNSTESAVGKLNPIGFMIDGMRYLVYGFPVSPSVANSDWHKPELNLRIKDIEDTQKFIIRIEQQTLVFCARRLEKNAFYKSRFEDFLVDCNDSLLSHHDVTQKPFIRDGAKFGTFFRPFCAEDMEGINP